MKSVRSSLAIAIAACALAGCSSDSDNTWSVLIDATKTSFSEPQSVTLEQAAAIPYASMTVKRGDGPEQIVVLAVDNQDGQLWSSAAKIALLTRNGRIWRTAGLGGDLSATQIRSADPLLRALHDGPIQMQRDVSFTDLNLYAVRLNCTLDAGVSDDAVVLGSKIHTLRVDEHCEAPSLGWSFVNQFWIGDPSGRVWKSIQYIHPGADPIATTLLRPAK